MSTRRTTTTLACAAALCCGLFSVHAFAQGAYPAKPVRVVLPLQAGSAADIAVRVFTERMGEALGKPLVVENIAGVGGLIGANRVVTEPADGYALAALNMTILAILPHMQPGQVKFDVLNLDGLQGFAQVLGRLFYVVL